MNVDEDVHICEISHHLNSSAIRLLLCAQLVHISVFQNIFFQRQ